MNFLKRFLEFIASPSNSRTTSLLVILIIALSIPLTVFVAQKQQEIRQQAAEVLPPGGTVDCESNRGICVASPDACDRIGSPAEGTCPAGGPSICCKKPQLPDIGGPKSTSCMSDSECISRKGNPILDTATCGDVLYRCDSTTAVGGAPTCKRPGLATCDYSKTPNKTEPVPCTSEKLKSVCAGKEVTSCVTVRECQSDNCWYDDGTPYEVCKEKTISATPTPPPPTAQVCSSTNCSLVAGNICINNQCVPRPNQVNCTVTPTCPSGFVAIGYPANQKYACVNDLNPDAPTNVSPICPSSTTPSGLTELQCNVAGGVCSAGCGTPDVAGTKLGTCSDNRICCKNDFLSKTPTVKGNDPCNGNPYPPSCSAVGGIAVKRQFDAGWFCYDGANFKGNAFCPTVTPTPTPPAPGSTQLAFTIGLDGLGTTGDNRSPENSSGSNKNPRRTSRNIKVEIFDSNNNSVGGERTGTITYASGKFTATVDLGTITTGNYTVKVKSDGYLKRRVSSGTTTIIAITAGQTNNLPAVNLATGDIDGNNRISILDYNLLIGCIFKQASGSCVSSDLDDDGNVTQFDYNLFIREFSDIQDGD